MLELRLGQLAVTVVVLLVVLEDQVGGVAIASVEKAVPLHLVRAYRARTAPHLTFGMGHRQPVAQAVDFAGIEAGKSLARGIAADDLFDEGAGFLGRANGHDANVAAAGTNVRAVGFRGALGDEDLVDVFRVAQQVGIQRVVAGVVDRHAVHRHAHLVGVHAAHGEAKARQAGVVFTGDVQAWGVLEFVDGIAGGRLFIQCFLGHRGAALDAFLRHHVTAPGGRLALYPNGADITVAGLCHDQSLAHAGRGHKCQMNTGELHHCRPGVGCLLHAVVEGGGEALLISPPEGLLGERFDLLDATQAVGGCPVEQHARGLGL